MSLEARRRSAPRAPDRVVWIDGELRRGAEAMLSVFDRGARDGEGLFETLRVYEGHPHQWTRHLERLVVSAAELGFPVPPSPRTLREGLEALLDAAGLRDAVARVTVTRGIPSGGGGRRTRTGSWIEVEPVASRLWQGSDSDAARVVYSRQPFEPGPLGRHKTTSRLAYSLAREEARAARAHEALLVSPSGWVLEGAVSNVFMVEAKRVYTPPLSLGILPGVTRASVLRLGADLGLEVSERLLTTRDLADADEIFVTNAVQGIVPVGELAGRKQTRHETSLVLRERYRAAIGRSDEAERGAAPPSVA